MRSFASIALLLSLLTWGCARHEPVSNTPNLPPLRVQLGVITAESVPQFTEVTGTVRPVQRAVLAAKEMGAITDFPITLGQHVKADAVLLKLFSAEATVRVTQARAQFNVARRDLEREQDLLAKGASTAESVRNLQDRFIGCEAALHEAETKLGYMEIRAPFDGVVARKLAQAGDLATPGMPLLELEGTSEFEVLAGVPDSLSASLATGATLACDAAGVAFTGTLREISSLTDPATRTIGVKIAVPAEASVRSGQFTRIQVPGRSVRALLVPATAVSVQGQMERVFVAGEGHRAVLRIVKTGATRAGRTEILAGLNEGDRVVLAPPAELTEGRPLEVQP